MSSGAIHLVDPAKKEVPFLLSDFEMVSSMALESPKSLMTAQPLSSIRILPCKPSSEDFQNLEQLTYALEVTMYDNGFEIVQVRDPRSNLNQLA